MLSLGLGGLVWVQKKIFAVKVRLFCCCFGRCLSFCMVFLVLFEGVLWCASMLLRVRMNVV